MTPEEYYPIPPTKTQKAIICLPKEVQVWKNENQTLKTRIAELEKDLEATEKRVREHKEHENQTHEILGKILGTDNTLENVARRAISKITELEKKNAVLEAQVAALKKIAEEERAAVLTADICDGGDGYRHLSICGMNAISGTPTRVDDFYGREERVAMAYRQLAEEHPEAFR